MMMKSSLFVLLFVVLVSIVRAETSDVLVLTKENFQQTIDTNSLILVEFYAPWCGHCQALAPEYEVAATRLKGKVPIAKVDCTVEQSICQANGIQGYPTLKIFRSGIPSPYEGARKADAIASLLEREILPPVTNIESKEELDAFLAANKRIVVGYFLNGHDDRFQTFETVARPLRQKISFASTTDLSILSPFGVSESSSIVLFRDFEEPQVLYHGELEISAVQKWVAASLLPTFGEINGETYGTYISTGLPVGYFFIDPKVHGDQPIVEQIKELAVEGKGKIVVSWIDNTLYTSQAGRLGLSGQNLAFSIEDYIAILKYVYPKEGDDFDIDEFRAWFRQFLAGELEPTIKSEEIPEPSDDTVRVVVRKNFNDVVLDETKDVLIEYYAPWCGHCKKLAPTYEKLGNLFKGSDVVIAKINVEANDVDPKYGVTGFPTLQFFPKENKTKWVEYSGDRSLDSLISFIKKQATTDINSIVGEEEEQQQEQQQEEGRVIEHNEL